MFLKLKNGKYTIFESNLEKKIYFGSSVLGGMKDFMQLNKSYPLLVGDNLMKNFVGTIRFSKHTRDIAEVSIEFFSSNPNTFWIKKLLEELESLADNIGIGITFMGLEPFPILQEGEKLRDEVVGFRLSPLPLSLHRYKKHHI